jgi:hypothetical protein
MDIASILNQAGGVGAIARELGVDEATVQSGVGALMPHVTQGVETHGLPDGAAQANSTASETTASEQSSGLGGMIGGLLAGAGGGGGLGSILSSGIGNQILGHIFGSKDGSRDVAAQASQQSGVDTNILKKLLPIVAGAVAMHYMTHANQPGATAVDGGGGGGVLGSILGGLGNR